MSNRIEGLPDPAPHARPVVEGALMLLGEIPILGSAIGKFAEHRREMGQAIIVDAVKRRGIPSLENLSDAQFEFFIPAANRFAQQLYLGEFEHNLRVLAEIIADGLVNAECSTLSKLQRVARSLEMLPHEAFVCIAMIKAATGIDHRRLDGATGTFTPETVISEARKRGKDIDPNGAEEMLSELESRRIILNTGLILASGHSKTFRTTNVYEDIISRVESIISAQSAPK